MIVTEGRKTNHHDVTINEYLSESPLKVLFTRALIATISSLRKQCGYVYNTCLYKIRSHIETWKEYPVLRVKNSFWIGFDEHQCLIALYSSLWITGSTATRVCKFVSCPSCDMHVENDDRQVSMCLSIDIISCSSIGEKYPILQRCATAKVPFTLWILSRQSKYNWFLFSDNDKIILSRYEIFVTNYLPLTDVSVTA